MKKIVDTEVRFWGLVKKGIGCWEWSAALTWNGYGRFALTPQNGVRAHRYAWESSFGEIPNGMCVCHICDNPKCVRPDHLFLGTHKENIEDRDAKGRRIDHHGIDNAMAKVSSEDVKTIRHLYFAERRAQREIGEFFGISQSQVSRIVLKQCWGSM